MAILSGVWQPEGEAANVPGSFRLKQYTGPGLLIATGDPVPDCLGTYLYGGEHNGAPYYKHETKAFYIWYFPRDNVWILSVILGEPAGSNWWRLATSEGEYAPGGDFSGNPFVAVRHVSVIRNIVMQSSRSAPWSRSPYPVSTYQLDCRRHFGDLSALYALIAPHAPIRVNTSCESAQAGGSPTPDVTGRYIPVFPPPQTGQWVNAGLGYDIWFINAWTAWVLAGTKPANPGPGDNYWQLDGVIWYGTYGPKGTATGYPIISSVALDGKYWYVGQYAGDDLWWNEAKCSFIWRHPVTGFWWLGTTYPATPTAADDSWSKAGPDPEGDYLGNWNTKGTAHVRLTN